MSDVTAKFTVNPRKAIETEFRIEATILDHDKLYNRDLPDQHPMAAITGLEEALDEKQDIISDLATIRSGAALGATAVQPGTLATELATKQDTLVSGTNIKTVNNQSLLGSGNITIGGAVDSVNGQTGAVVLTASDVGALPDSTVIPTVNNSTISFTQGGVSKGSFTLNQATGATIALDAGGGGSDVEAFTAAEVQAIWDNN